LVFSPIIWAIIAIFTIFFLIGFIDDFLKVKYNSSNGLRGKKRLFIQFFSVILVIFIIDYNDYIKDLTTLYFPIVDWKLDLGILYYIFAFLVVVGSCNAVNLTDGLDGLVSIPLIVVFSVLAFIAAKTNFNYNDINVITNICLIAIGVILAFLIFNFHPAKIFMGDSGSVPLGALIGFIAVILKQEIIFAVISGLFVIEALSVIIQVLYFKKTRKRVFLMAPIHHHFEKKGWSEQKVVFVFWVVSLLFAMLGIVLFL